MSNFQINLSKINFNVKVVGSDGKTVSENSSDFEDIVLDCIVEYFRKMSSDDFRHLIKKSDELEKVEVSNMISVPREFVEDSLIVAKHYKESGQCIRPGITESVIDTAEELLG